MYNDSRFLVTFALILTIILIAVSLARHAHGAVLICSDYGCVSSPYFPPIPWPVRPPVIVRDQPLSRLPPPLPPLGPTYPPEPRYPLAPPQPNLRPSIAKPYPPLGNPPQPPKVEALPPMTQDQEREDIIRQGEEFCRKYQRDPICHPPKK